MVKDLNSVGPAVGGIELPDDQVPVRFEQKNLAVLVPLILQGWRANSRHHQAYVFARERRLALGILGKLVLFVNEYFSLRQATGSGARRRAEIGPEQDDAGAGSSHPSPSPSSTGHFLQPL